MEDAAPLVPKRVEIREAWAWEVLTRATVWKGGFVFWIDSGSVSLWDLRTRSLWPVMTSRGRDLPRTVPWMTGGGIAHVRMKGGRDRPGSVFGHRTFFFLFFF